MSVPPIARFGIALFAFVVAAVEFARGDRRGGISLTFFGIGLLIFALLRLRQHRRDSRPG